MENQVADAIINIYNTDVRTEHCVTNVEPGTGLGTQQKPCFKHCELGIQMADPQSQSAQPSFSYCDFSDEKNTL